MTPGADWNANPISFFFNVLLLFLSNHSHCHCSHAISSSSHEETRRKHFQHIWWTQEKVFMQLFCGGRERGHDVGGNNETMKAYSGYCGPDQSQPGNNERMIGILWPIDFSIDISYLLNLILLLIEFAIRIIPFWIMLANCQMDWSSIEAVSSHFQSI